MTAPASPAPKGRTFRLSPPDRTGLMFGLTLAQLLLIGGGVVIGSILMVSVSVPLGLVVLVTGSSVGLVRLHGASLVELAPQAERYLRQAAAERNGLPALVRLDSNGDDCGHEC